MEGIRKKSTDSSAKSPSEKDCCKEEDDREDGMKIAKFQVTDKIDAMSVENSTAVNV